MSLVEKLDSDVLFEGPLLSEGSMETIQHELRQFDPGIVWLDEDNLIVAMNAVATETFGEQPDDVIGRDILQLHPKSSRDEVKWLLDHSSDSAESDSPVAIMIDIFGRMLLIKASKMCGKEGCQAGRCMVFYDLTNAATLPAELQGDEPGGEAKRKLYKLPVYKDKQVLLLDPKSICCIKADGRYSTLYTESEDYFCNLSISDLESRLDERFFFRVHRSHMVNLHYAKAFEKIDDQCYLIIDHRDGMKVPISRNNVNSLKQVLGLN